MSWESSPLELHADDVMSSEPTTSGKLRLDRTEIEQWLKDKLSKGSVWVQDLEAAAKDEHRRWGSVYKASRRLEVVKTQTGGNKGSKVMWTLRGRPFLQNLEKKKKLARRPGAEAARLTHEASVMLRAVGQPSAVGSFGRAGSGLHILH